MELLLKIYEILRKFQKIAVTTYNLQNEVMNA